MKKRYQECNWLVKLWRRRFYVYIPFKWVWYSAVENFVVTDDQTGNIEFMKGKMLWKLLQGDASISMNHVFTHEEVMNSFKDK